MRLHKRLISFNDYLRYFAIPELQEHAASRYFPKSNRWRDYKLYLNSNNLSDEAILCFDELWEAYFTAREGATA